MNEGPSIISGTWHSASECESTGPGQPFTGERDVSLVLDGSVVHIRSLPGNPASSLEMDLEFRENGALTGGEQALTGTWRERTAPANGGRDYAGMALFVLAKDCRSMAGRWSGGEPDIPVVNEGTWTLTFVSTRAGH
jgi:hypothetical protein